MAQTGLGALGALVYGAFSTVNAAGIPRWAPQGLSLALGTVALLSWSPLLVSRLLAAFWALSAGAFASPGIRAAGFVGLPLWIFAAAVALALGAIFIRGGQAPISALACCSAVTATAMVGAVLVLPASSSTDALVYPVLLVLAYPSWLLGRIVRRWGARS